MNENLYELFDDIILSDFSITKISKNVGYSSPSKFSQAFREYIGCTPSEYKK